MKVLGISAYFHDAAAALVVDGTIVAAAQEERFSRVKHDKRLPVSAVAFCLEQAGLTIGDVDHVVFYEKPLRKFERILVTHLRTFPRGLGQFSRAVGTWLSKRLWLRGEICTELGVEDEQLMFSEHHLSHAASAFLCGPHDSAAIITADGVGEWATTTIYSGRTTDSGIEIEPLRELCFPHSIGLLYSAITAYLGFAVNDGEYKVMGLAGYGTPRFLPLFDQLARIGDDGALELDMTFFMFDRHPTKSFTPKLEALLGPAREPGQTWDIEGDDARFADVAASLQAFTERYLLALTHEAQRLTGAKHLTMAGGVALNSVANYRVLADGPFESLYIQPAAGDAGGALGAALYVTHVIEGVPRQPAVCPTLLGAAHSPEAIGRFLTDCGVKHRRFEQRDELCEAVVSLLADGGVGGWFQGRFEWGPRALGARSILADARGAGVRDRMNAKIKFRERFRPFAPAVLEDEVDRWFELPSGKQEHLTEHMGCVAPARPEAQALLPAVVHVDGTARLQKVTAKSSPPLYELLEHFRRRTGVGVLLNTSMNLKDEPICSSPAEAYGTYLRSDMDFLVLENCLIERSRLS